MSFAQDKIASEGLTFDDVLLAARLFGGSSQGGKYQIAVLQEHSA